MENETDNEDIYEKLTFEKALRESQKRSSRRSSEEELEEEDNMNVYPMTQPTDPVYDYDNSDKNQNLMRCSSTGTLTDDAKGPIYDFAVKPEPIYSKVSKHQKAP